LSNFDYGVHSNALKKKKMKKESRQKTPSKIEKTALPDSYYYPGRMQIMFS